MAPDSAGDAGSETAVRPATTARPSSCPRRPFPCAPACRSASRKSSRPGPSRTSTTTPAQGAPGGRRAALRAARRPALRQRRHPHRPCAAKDAEGLRRPLALRARLRRRLRARLGLPRPADRVEDRGGAPRQGPAQGRGLQGRVPRPLPRVRRPLDRRADARSFKRLGVLGDWEHRYSTMDFAARRPSSPSSTSSCRPTSSIAAPSR